MQCPCCSGLEYSECCKPYHDGTKRPSTPLALMRSRYSGYALGKVNYIIETTDPSSPYFEADRKKWFEAIDQFCKTTQFLKLEILDSDETTVHFIAHLKQQDEFPLEEKSHFRKRNGKWLYISKIQ